MMFYLYKMGVYGQGVFWIGEDYEEGQAKADEYAAKDGDDYHEWDLYSYNPITEESVKVYTTKKGQTK